MSHVLVTVRFGSGVGDEPVGHLLADHVGGAPRHGGLEQQPHLDGLLRGDVPGGHRGLDDLVAVPRPERVVLVFGDVQPGELGHARGRRGRGDRQRVTPGRCVVAVDPDGNIFIAGTAPVHNGAPSAVTEKAVQFAARLSGKTGLYVSLS